MKNIMMTVLALSLSMTLSAQNKNVQKETKTTTVTVNDGTQPKKVVKTEKKEAVQRIELKDAQSKKLNKDIRETPVQVNSTTTISGDGMPLREVDRSSYYELNGKKYHFASDKTGYRISTDEGSSEVGLLRRTSNNNYIYRTKDRVSVGYFDSSGNFVVETYDDKTDGVTVETYTRVKQ